MVVRNSRADASNVSSGDVVTSCCVMEFGNMVRDSRIGARGRNPSDVAPGNTDGNRGRNLALWKSQSEGMVPLMSVGGDVLVPV